MYPSELGSLVTALWSSWLSLMTGIGGLALTIYGVWRRKEPTGRVLFFIGLLSLFVASISIWVDEHRARKYAESTSKGLRAQLADKDARLQDLNAKVKALESRPLEVKVKQTKPDPDRIELFLQYAYEWNYEDARNVLGQIAKRIDRKIPLRKRHSASEERLQIGILNENDIPLEDVWFTAEFPGEEVQVRPDGPWQAMLPNRQYFVRLGEISNNVGLGPSGSLFVKFPKPGRYHVNYIIKAKWLPQVVKSIDIILE